MLSSRKKLASRKSGASAAGTVSRTARLAATNAALQAEIAERKQAERALRDSEERFRSVLENSLDAAYRRNLQTDRYDYLSPVFETITGVSIEEMCGDNIAQVLGRVHPDDALAVEAEIGRLFSEAARNGRATGSVEYRFRGQDSRYMWLADHITVLTDNTGVPLYRLGIVQDVTERKRAETELSRTRDELASLLAISQSLVSTLKLSTLIELLLQRVHGVIDYDGAALYLLDGDDLVVSEYVGPMDRAEALLVRLPVNECPACRDVVVDMRTVRVDDMFGDNCLARKIRTQSPPVQRQLTGNCRSWLGVPLVVKGQAIGMLRLSHTEPDHFTEEQARLAASVANQAAIAIENARLYQQVQANAALEERQRLARELHDSISQVLYGIGLAAHVAMNSIERKPEKARASLEQVLGLVQTGLSEMRALILELRPELISSEGLVAAIEKQALALRSRQEIRIHADLCDEPDLPDEAKDMLYRIALEAMSNASKHAKAHRIDVRLACEGDSVCLQVTDDGMGFDPYADYPGHLGLRSMRERAQKAGARFTLESAVGAGSCVEVCLPARATR